MKLDIRGLAVGLVLVVTTTVACAGTPETMPSGLIYESIREGTGQQASPALTVQVNYRGMLENGKEFDSSYQRGQPATFPLHRVIPCWTEGVSRMREGGKARLTCPPSIAYGSRGAGSVIPPNATLTFEVELLKIVR